ncbi:lysylphosphatidylglycerol synthase transmembrane domain-containing protein [Aquimarina sp. RZ0]|uniref:lysylphosphatidylglycerol synthase transmembrane domain-containing protein n=1 Tax=Aquimarina sp. RZ0 TaxID=2607730 RepID=UPI00165F63FE|nr:lysylphosphatidylglycerol synthase transmembrane domain-containing protein [Aquimarina sp. RZ0]
MKKKKKHLFSTFLKIGVTIFLLYLVFTKIPFTKVWDILKHANITLLLMALFCFVLSQWISAERLSVLFRSVNFFLTPRSNHILYLIGMFYNFFIPGGIGGDAYKIYILHKEFNWSVKKLSAAVFVDRFMGLTAIGILICIFSFFVPGFFKEMRQWFLPLLLSISITASYFFVKRLFPSFFSVFTKTIIQSIAVQLLQCICIVILLESITNTHNHLIYITVFLISSVVSVFSFSGIGIREMIFYQAAILFVFDSTVAVTIGLLFSVMTAFVSLFGILFQFKNPKLYIKTINSMLL